MLDIKACAVCFNTNGKLINMDDQPDSQLRIDYNTISGLHTYPSNGMLVYLCVECCRYVQRFIEFQRRCQRAYFALKAILFNKKINQTDLEELKSKGYDVASPLAYLDPNRMHYEEVEHSDDKPNKIIKKSSDHTTLIPISQYNITIDGETENIISNVVEIIYQGDEHMSNVDALSLEDYDLKFEMINKVKNQDTIDQKISNVNDQILHNLNAEFTNPNNEQYEGVFYQEQSKVDDLETLNVEEITFIASDNDCPESDTENYKPPEAAKIDLEKMAEKNEASVPLVEEYAILQKITMSEARAAMEVKIMFSMGLHQCEVCNRKFTSEKGYETHFRRHGKHTSGMFMCEICQFYFQTDNLLKTHMNDKHMYKYRCRKCPEISFERVSAKTHYYSTHCEKKPTQTNSTEEKALDLPPDKRVSRKRKKKTVVKTVPKKSNKLPEDYITYAPQSQEEQYNIVLQRQYTTNYIESEYKCTYCFRGFRTLITYNNHMKKHDPAVSGEKQCDMCKLCYKSHYEIYHHMTNIHVRKFACKLCDFVHVNRNMARNHYLFHNKHKKLKCPHCNMEYTRQSSLSSHIRFHHPSTCICNICGHSFVSQFGLYFHQLRTHSKEEKEEAAAMIVNMDNRLYCSDCEMQFLTAEAFETHFSSSQKHAITNTAISRGIRQKFDCNVTTKSAKSRGIRQKNDCNVTTKRKRSHTSSCQGISTPCSVCDKVLKSEVEMRKHYKEEHPGTNYPARFICEICGHATRQHVALQMHMYTHNKERPFKCPYCERTFTNSYTMNNHILIHTGEKPHECAHCNRFFRQKITLKLHIQTVHLKIPYPPWNKKNRRRKAKAKAEELAALSDE